MKKALIDKNTTATKIESWTQVEGTQYEANRVNLTGYGVVQIEDEANVFEVNSTSHFWAEVPESLVNQDIYYNTANNAIEVINHTAYPVTLPFQQN